MKLIVGLGNPGKEYAITRHNAGWLLLDKFAEQNKIAITKKKFDSLLGEGIIDNKKVILLKPQTYMNLSGKAVVAAKQFYKLSLLDILVLHDDIDLPFGKIRFREKGSSGGHNGLNSLIESLGDKNFARVKIGIGHPGDKKLVPDFVLSKFTTEELNNLPYQEGIKLIKRWLMC